MLALNFREFFREFGEILGKYSILDGRSVGSKGLTDNMPNLGGFYQPIRNKIKY